MNSDSNPYFSAIIPAWNEESEIGRTIMAIQTAFQEHKISVEIIVVNDESTDQTRPVSLAAGAKVIDVAIHNIGGVRNSGARVANGEWLLFVDADTRVNGRVVGEMLKKIETGVVGGGAWIEFDKPITLAQRFTAFIFSTYWFTIRGWAAGCFIFIRRDVFESIGGFNEKFFAAEEMHLSKAMKARGKFAICKNRVLTSSRKLRAFGLWKLIKIAVPALWKVNKLNTREGLEVLYTEVREKKLLN